MVPTSSPEVVAVASDPRARPSAPGHLCDQLTLHPRDPVRCAL